MSKQIILAVPLMLSGWLLVYPSSYPRSQITGTDTVTIIGVGDIMMGSNYPDDSGLPPAEGQYLFQDVANVLQDADVTMGNLEGVLLNGGGTPKTCKNPKVCYVFRSPEGYVSNLVNAGFDVLSVANNHAGDFGWSGTQSTLRVLEGAGLNHAGQLAKPYTVFEKNGVRYGFVAMAPNAGCVSLHDLQTAGKIVAHLDSVSDIVIVSFHGGAEGPQYQQVPKKTEVFYGENRGNVYELAHRMVDAGADIVLGHGPHVVRAVEVYKDRFIAYSLGNFCTYGGINVSGINGLAPIIKVYANREGAFLQAKITPGIQTFLAPVKIDPEKQVIRKIQELTRQDFPELKLNFTDDGWIRKSTD